MSTIIQLQRLAEVDFPMNTKEQSRMHRHGASAYIQVYKPIIKYVRHGRKPFGVMVAEKIDGNVYFGWSLCNRKDRFNKKEGLYYAIKRMNQQRENGTQDEMPRSIAKWFDKFFDRATRYYYGPKSPN